MFERIDRIFFHLGGVVSNESHGRGCDVREIGVRDVRHVGRSIRRAGSGARSKFGEQRDASVATLLYGDQRRVDESARSVATILDARRRELLHA